MGEMHSLAMFAWVIIMISVVCIPLSLFILGQPFVALVMYLVEIMVLTTLGVIAMILHPEDV